MEESLLSWAVDGEVGDVEEEGKESDIHREILKGVTRSTCKGSLHKH